MQFDELIHPTDPVRFFDEYWQHQPLVIRRSSPAYYGLDLGLADVEGWLSRGRIRYPEIRLMRNGSSVPAETLLTGGWSAGVLPGDDRPARLPPIYDAYRNGYTIVLRAEKVSGAVATLCRTLEQKLQHNTVGELYLTPRGAQGFAVHSDVHDVFVLQLAGAKQWKVYAPPDRTKLRLPMEKRVGEPLLDVTIEPGDLLYVPVGFPHQAVALPGQASLHVSLGVYPFRWTDLLAQVLQAAAEENPELAEPLPATGADWDTDALQARMKVLLRELAERADVRSGLDRLKVNFCSGLRALPDGHFAHLDALEDIHGGTVVEKRPGSICYISRQRTSTTMVFPGNRVEIAPAAVPAMEWIANVAEPFTPTSLPGEIGDDDRVMLVKELVAAGLLRIRA